MRNNKALPSAFADSTPDPKHSVRTDNSPRESPFAGGMFDIPSGTYTRRSTAQFTVSMLLHLGLIALLMVVPGYFVTKVVTQAPPDVTYVFTPPAPLPPPPAAAAAAAPRALKAMTPTPQPFRPQPLVAPQMLPKSVEMANSAAPPSFTPDLGIRRREL
jgi:hypothetical protein